MAYDLQKEEDVKDFLENLSIEYRFECFHEKKPDGCHRLADFLEAVKKDYKKAAKIYQSNCDENKYAHSCFKFGNYSFLGKGIKEDSNQALKYYDTSCSMDYPEGCLHTGLMMTSAKDTSQRNYKEGIGYLEKGCNLRNASSCHIASGFYLGGAPDLPKDMKKAFEYAKKGCELSNIYCCTNLSLMYKNGHGTPKNEQLSEKYKAIAVDMRDQMTKQMRQVEFEQGT